MAEIRRIGEIRDFDHLQAMLREVADDRGMSRLTIDAQAGLADGHAAKLLAPIPTKRMGTETMPKLLKALAVRLVLEDDPEGLADLGDLLHGRTEKKANTYRASIKLKTLSYVNKVAGRLVRRQNQKLASSGGKARASKLTTAHLKRIAKIAANARWQKYRRARKEAKILEEQSKCQALVTAASRQTGKALKPSKSS